MICFFVAVVMFVDLMFHALDESCVRLAFVFMLCTLCSLCAALFSIRYFKTSLPTGFEKKTVLIVTEDGAATGTEVYYQDSNGDYYIRCDDTIKFLLVPFCKAEYKKVPPPVFKNGNLTVKEQDVLMDNYLVQKYCLVATTY